MLRKYLIDLEFPLKLFFLKVAALRDFDHDVRMDLVDKGDAPFPDPVYIRELLPDLHNSHKVQQFRRGSAEALADERLGEVSTEKRGVRQGRPTQLTI